MPCYKPLRAYLTPGGVVFSELARHDIIKTIYLACNQCHGCRMRRASDWELRVMHEAQSWPENCFITLTYGEGNLPANNSLHYRDYQLFMKRLRKEYTGRTIRFYMCGEYGEQRGRPHYHACIFNLDFDDQVPAGKSKSGQIFYTSETLTRIWGLGHATVQPLVHETASYCARYIMKKVLGDEAKTAYAITTDDGEILQRTPEFANMSLRPGIGSDWIDKFSSDVYPLDACVARGIKRAVPKFYDRRVKANGVDLDTVIYEREKRVRARHEDNTDERLAVRLKVDQAKCINLKRDL